MSDVKWIKLSVNMFEDEKIKLIRKMPEGNNILLVWIYLLVLAGKCNDGGYIYLAEDVPYTDEMLATVMDMPLNTIRLALETFKKLKMIDIDEEQRILIVNWEKHQNIDGLEKIREQNRERQRRFRERKKQEALASGEEGKESNVTVTLHNALDKNKNRLDTDIDKDITTAVDNNTSNNVTVTLQQQQLQKIIEVFNQNIHPITPLETQKITDWLNDIEADVVVLAIEEAVKNNVRKLSYIEKILKTWVAQGLKTKADVEAYRRDWQDRKAGSETQPINQPIKTLTEQLKEKYGNLLAGDSG